MYIITTGTTLCGQSSTPPPDEDKQPFCSLGFYPQTPAGGAEKRTADKNLSGETIGHMDE